MDKATCALCDDPVLARGWCVKHYCRWQRYGDASYVRPKRVLGKCAVDNCDRLEKARGYCNRHYENLRRYGDPVPQRDKPLDVRLEAIGWTVTESGCWEWNGKRNDNGYGIFDAKRLGYVLARAHRVMYEHVTGETIGDLQLRHKCDNPPCVNPDHLIPGTAADNVQDMVERGRHWMHGRTRCPNDHDLTLPGAKNSRGCCVECDRARKRRYAKRKLLNR